MPCTPLNLNDPAVLKELKEATGFIPATDEDYKFVRKGMQLSRKCDGIKNKRKRRVKIYLRPSINIYNKSVNTRLFN